MLVVSNILRKCSSFFVKNVGLTEGFSSFSSNRGPWTPSLTLFFFSFPFLTATAVTKGGHTLTFRYQRKRRKKKGKKAFERRGNAKRRLRCRTQVMWMIGIEVLGISPSQCTLRRKGGSFLLNSCQLLHILKTTLPSLLWRVDIPPSFFFSFSLR
jgi:hypothetical protein